MLWICNPTPYHPGHRPALPSELISHLRLVVSRGITLEKSGHEPKIQHIFLHHYLERVKGNDPSYSDWQPDALPLCYTRNSCAGLSPLVTISLVGLGATQCLPMVDLRGIEPRLLPCKSSALPDELRTRKWTGVKESNLDKRYSFQQTLPKMGCPITTGFPRSHLISSMTDIQS